MPQVSENFARYLLPTRQEMSPLIMVVDLMFAVIWVTVCPQGTRTSTALSLWHKKLRFFPSPRLAQAFTNNGMTTGWTLCTSAGASRQWLCELNSQRLATSEEPPDVGLAHHTHDELDASEDSNAHDEDATDEGFG